MHHVGRYGTDRVAKLVLVGAVPPLKLQSDDNPEGLPIDFFDAIRAGERANRSQLYRDLADGPFFGHNRDGDVARRSATRSGCSPWRPDIAARMSASPLSATDFRPDLAKVDVPTMVIHGDDDQIVPFEVGGKRSAELIDGAVLKVYEGGAHALTDTDRGRLHADLLEFLNN